MVIRYIINSNYEYHWIKIKLSLTQYPSHNLSTMQTNIRVIEFFNFVQISIHPACHSQSTPITPPFTRNPNSRCKRLLCPLSDSSVSLNKFQLKHQLTNSCELYSYIRGWGHHVPIIYVLNCSMTLGLICVCVSDDFPVFKHSWVVERVVKWWRSSARARWQS